MITQIQSIKWGINQEWRIKCAKKGTSRKMEKKFTGPRIGRRRQFDNLIYSHIEWMVPEWTSQENTWQKFFLIFCFLKISLAKILSPIVINTIAISVNPIQSPYLKPESVQTLNANYWHWYGFTKKSSNFPNKTMEYQWKPEYQEGKDFKIKEYGIPLRNIIPGSSRKKSIYRNWARWCVSLM